MRAPETWQGLGCFHRSDVWSLAAMVLVWLQPKLLGTSGMFQDPLLWPEPWSMAKLMRLFPDWTGTPAAASVIEKEAKFAKALTTELDPENQGQPYVNLGSLDDELRELDVPEEVANMLRYLLVLRQESRPSAVEALASLEYEVLVRRAAGRRD